MKSNIITEEAFAAAALKLNCDVAAIKAVAEVESRGVGFLPSDKPKILFERHKFHKYSGGRFSATHPDISNPRSGGYGAEGEWQWKRFSRAFALDARAAMMSCSWGAFQIMGFNFASLGFASVDAFVDAMKESVDRHLEAFVQYIIVNGLAGRLRRHDWAGLAAGYNGEDFRRNHYDTKLAAAHRKWTAHETGEKQTGHSVVDLVEPVPDTDSDEEQHVTSELDKRLIEKRLAQEEMDQRDMKGPGDADLAAKASTPAQEPHTIPAIPPLTAHIPDWAKRVVGWGAGANVTGIAGAFIFLRDNPQALMMVLGILKWTIIAIVGAGLLIMVGVFALKLYYAKLANDLNKARLQNYSDKDTHNVDFSGWKGVAPGELPKT